MTEAKITPGDLVTDRVGREYAVRDVRVYVVGDSLVWSLQLRPLDGGPPYFWSVYDAGLVDPAGLSAHDIVGYRSDGGTTGRVYLSSRHPGAAAWLRRHQDGGGISDPILPVIGGWSGAMLPLLRRGDWVVGELTAYQASAVCATGAQAWEIVVPPLPALGRKPLEEFELHEFAHLRRLDACLIGGTDSAHDEVAVFAHPDDFDRLSHNEARDIFAPGATAFGPAGEPLFRVAYLDQDRLCYTYDASSPDRPHAIVIDAPEGLTILRPTPGGFLRTDHCGVVRIARVLVPRPASTVPA